jgi:hypothetical protein
MPDLLLYQFRYYDEVRRGWVRSRYRATVEDIRARHAQYELLGEPEKRPVGDPKAVTPSGKGPM